MQPILYYGQDPYLRQQLGGRPNSYSVPPRPQDPTPQRHPCAKPLILMRWLVQRASLPGETVLDMFAGSCTTGIACIEQGRLFIGIELDPYFWEAACRRIEDAYQQPDFFLPQPTRAEQLTLVYRGKEHLQVALVDKE
jgi:DNA modification methylase